MASFLNHVVIVYEADANAVTDSDPSNAAAGSGGTVAHGSVFTPTAGRLLHINIYGGVTSTTPTGWTLEESAINSGGLYAWSRTAAGSDTISTTHNGSGYPTIVEWFEYEAGSTWFGNVASVGEAQAASNPNLTGLTGTNLVMGMKGSHDGAFGFTSGSGAWNGANIESCDIYQGPAGSVACWMGSAYQADYVSASYQPTCTLTVSHGGGCEEITLAITVVEEEIAVQSIYPDSDVTRVGWVTNAAGTTNLWDSINETSASDADYITVSV